MTRDKYKQGQKRQGDVLLTPLSRAPVRKTPAPWDGVLARGEATGHAHRVIGETLLWNIAGQQYNVLEVKERGVVLSHEQHPPHTLPEKWYEVRTQREDRQGGAGNVYD